MNNEDLNLLTEINTMAQDPVKLKHMIHDKEIINFLGGLSSKYSREALQEAIKKIKEAA
jgi:hypothetical protein